MPVSLSKLIDGAFVMALCTALLYLFGVADSQGTASALSVPLALVRNDIWTTVGEGGHALIMLALAPALLLTSPETNWQILTIAFFCPFVFLLLLFIPKLRRHAGTALVLVACYLLFVLVWSVSNTSTRASVRDARDCFRTAQCSSSSKILHLVISNVGDERMTRHGILLAANDTYWTLFSKDGLLILPVDGVKLVEEIPQ